MTQSCITGEQNFSTNNKKKSGFENLTVEVLKFPKCSSVVAFQKP